VNWKLFMEANLEGITSSRRTNVLSIRVRQPDADRDVRPQQPRDVPIRRIEKFARYRRNNATSPATSRTYHLFPNVIIAALSNHTTMSVPNR
jgi:hypothetical protein